MPITWERMKGWQLEGVETCESCGPGFVGFTGPKRKCFKSFFNSNKNSPFWKNPSPTPTMLMCFVCLKPITIFPSISACRSSLGVLPSAYGRWEWGSGPRRRSPPALKQLRWGVHQLLMLKMVIPPLILIGMSTSQNYWVDEFIPSYREAMGV